ncbi:MAG: MipA/OmpV family protein [Desulfovibrionaceae bacterium]|nr:MipA/OmpV family protein [Desulfovibrionaceae bacterium]
MRRLPVAALLPGLVLTLVLVLAFLASGTARAAGALENYTLIEKLTEGSRVQLGLGGGFSVKEYRDYAVQASPVPIIHYESRYVYVRGLTGGFNFFKNEDHELSVTLSYLPQSFYADMSDNNRMKELDDRFSTMMAGLSWNFKPGIGYFNLSGQMDVLGVNNGVTVQASYGLPVPFGWGTLTPVIGAVWTDANYNDYYYGISRSESRRSGYRTYDGEACVSPYMDLVFNVPLTEHISLNVSAKAAYLPDSVSDSPMVDKSCRFSAAAGVSYQF